MKPLSSLDLVDSILNIDDQLDSYLQTLQPTGMEQPYPFQDASLQMPFWSGEQPGVPQQLFPQNVFFPSEDLQSGLQQAPAQLVTTGGDPGFMFQSGGSQNLLKAQTESGSSTGNGRKRSSSSGHQDLGKKNETTTLQKNRQAQRRFRERQKAKVKNLHTEIEELRAKVEALQVENSALTSQNSILEKVLSMRDEQINSLQERKDVLELDGPELCDGTVAEHGSSLVLTHLKGKSVTLTWKALKTMTGDQLLHIWQAYVGEISDALVHVRGDDGSAVKHINDLVNELCKLCMRTSEVNPVAMQALHTLKKKTTSETEEVKAWQESLDSLELTKEQKGEIIQLRKRFLPKVQRLMKERGKLNLTTPPTLPSAVVGHRISLDYLKTHHMVGRLKEILRDEHKAMVEFAVTVVKKVLNPIQIAKLVVQSYPVKPDLLAISSAIAMEQGEDLGIPSNMPLLECSPDGFSHESHNTLAPFLFNSCGIEVPGDNVLTRMEILPGQEQS